MSRVLLALLTSWEAFCSTKRLLEGGTKLFTEADRLQRGWPTLSHSLRVHGTDRYLKGIYFQLPFKMATVTVFQGLRLEVPDLLPPKILSTRAEGL